MPLHCYRSILWWDGEELRLLSAESRLSSYDTALLARLRRVTLQPSIPYHFGEIMSDDTSSALRITTPPEDEPVTLAQAKAFLRIEHTVDDETIATAISAARHYAEAYLRTALLPQGCEYVRANPCSARLELPFGPARSIEAILFANEAGDATELHEANYRRSADGFTVHLRIAPSVETVTVQYEAGAYATVADIPAPIVQGMLHHIAVMVEARDGAAPLPMQSMNCYAPFRRVSL